MELIHASKRIFIWRLESPHLARTAYGIIHNRIGKKFDEATLNDNHGTVLSIRLPLN